MSHLRAPAARADRREGGRHGRPVARPAPALPETLIRPQLMRLAVLPPVAVALAATAAVVFTVRAGGAHTGLVLWAVLALTVVVAGAAIGIAAVAADRAARSVGDRVGALRRNAARGEADLRALVDALRRGEPPPRGKPRRRPPEDADDFELLAADLARAHDGAVTAVVRAAQLSSQAANEQKLEVFVNLARRLQSLVHREISILDELENEIEDPDLLKGLFHVDHLATRIRRHAENLAVLGGAVSRRQWSNPVDMTEVLRSAIAEVEQYSRVKLVPPVEGELRGHAVADVIHLLAELVENATVFSAPQTQVLLRANLVTSGLAIEVEDRGLGMPVEEQHRMNALLADPDQVNVASLLADGRIGLYVVSQLARRHGISVRLQTNIYGGVQAVLVVPQGLLGVSAGVGQEVAGPGAEVAGAVEAAAPSTPSAPSAPATGRHRQAARRESGADTGTAAPPPLPMRGAQEQRANPAEAVPGISAGDRTVVEANAGVLPTPRVATAPLATERPSLPRRRAQEHIAPQLRGGPVPRQDNDVVVGHDPGLMAAFQRGIGLAESQQSLEAAGEGFGQPAPGGEGSPAETAYGEGTHTEAPHMGAEDMASAHMEAEPMELPHMEVGHMGPAHVGVGHMEPPHMEPDHMEPDHMAPTPMESDHTLSPSLEPNHMASDHTVLPPTEPNQVAADRMAPDHMASDHTVPPPTEPHHMAPNRMEPDPTPPGPLDRSAPPA
ncbi:ATP-binding protein [Streptomyces bauhiniae]|uniref:histidine kinase n=1 Tax=Streptomyces bauhiniae TaxID=2340725 RepID=A0A4Z1DCT8_9ACTN|nr:ATP-binding protein [Streptomyces bauhiniae]TGN79880.1 ATP-binding protein [Streptomyces bauhiniae]